MNKTEAYEIVLKDLKKVSMFRGKYDAKNGDRPFMYGVFTVMEHIAEQAGDEYFTVRFVKNMLKSEEKND